MGRHLVQPLPAHLRWPCSSRVAQRYAEALQVTLHILLTVLYGMLFPVCPVLHMRCRTAHQSAHIASREMVTHAPCNTACISCPKASTLLRPSSCISGAFSKHALVCVMPSTMCKASCSITAAILIPLSSDGDSSHLLQVMGVQHFLSVLACWQYVAGLLAL